MEKFFISHRIHRTHRILMIYDDDKQFFEFTDLSQFHATASAVLTLTFRMVSSVESRASAAFILWR